MIGRSMERRARNVRATRYWACLAFTAIGVTGGASAAPQTLFEITNFAIPASSLTYFTGFSGTVGVTNPWPAEMGWQGDRIDIAFNLASPPPGNAAHYRFRVVVTTQLTQQFDLTVLAGPALDQLSPVHTEYMDTARVYSATIPLDHFVVGQTNYIRMQGAAVQVGNGQPSGIRWTRWTLTRTDPPMTLDALRMDQLQRLTLYLQNSIQPSGLVRDSLTLSPSNPPFHPATPDAAGFALIGLCASDRFGVDANAAQRVRQILSAYSGHTPGVTPTRNTLGHWWHWMNISNGSPAAGWAQEYTTIGSALLVAGALFARNHFIDDPQIVAFADELYATCNFDRMIHSSLDGRIFLATNASGGEMGSVRPWNEYQLIESLALRQPGATRSPAVAGLWLDPLQCPRRLYGDISTLTDNPAAFAPAFWVHQAYYFNPDFSGHPGFVELMHNHRRADELYTFVSLAQRYRYGLTAGVSPSGYTVDRILAGSNTYSPEAVGAWGEMDTLLEYSQDQNPTSDSRFRYGLTRVNTADPAWIPFDAGLVDHTFLMFGIAESIDPSFFKARQPFQPDSDGDGLADAHDVCPDRYNRRQEDADHNGIGDACDCGVIWADAQGDGDVDLLDFAEIQACPAANGPVAERCYCFDRNESQSLDALDLTALSQCLNAGGPDVPADPGCGL